MSPLPFIANHLWQSTLFAACAALATLGLRTNRAGARYLVWLAASIKFLVPFGWLAAIGRTIGPWALPRIAAGDLPAAVDAVGVPFSRPLAAFVPAGGWTSAAASASIALPRLLVLAWTAGAMALVWTWWTRWRRVVATVDASPPICDGPEVDALRRLERAAGLRRPIALVASPSACEPGVFGVRRPRLLWPARISALLAPAQVDAILAHEVSHVRRRDNLAAGIHMVVETLFWFHPLVWWIGARLVEERERACDEAVVRLGSEPAVYAEGILRTCRLFAASPLPCVAGVTGSNLARRIERIMRDDGREELGGWKRLALALAVLAVVCGPIGLGAVNAPRARAAASDVRVVLDTVSLKANTSGEPRVMSRIEPGGLYNGVNLTARALVQSAFFVQPFQIDGMPDWTDLARYDITMKFHSESGQGRMWPAAMLSVLQERFHLSYRRETRQMPIYALVMKGQAPGAQLRRASPGCEEVVMPVPPRDVGTPRPPQSVVEVGRVMTDLSAMPCGVWNNGPSGLLMRKVTLDSLARTLSSRVNRFVVDQTGLIGEFDVELHYTPGPFEGPGPLGALRGAPPRPSPADATGLPIFTALPEQLGLVLQPTTGPVDVIVVEHFDRPSND